MREILNGLSNLEIFVIFSLVTLVVSSNILWWMTRSQRNRFAILFVLSRTKGYVDSRELRKLLKDADVNISYGGLLVECSRLETEGWLFIGEGHDENGSFRSYCFNGSALLPGEKHYEAST